MRRIVRISLISLLVLVAVAGCASHSYQKAPAAVTPDITILSNRDYFPAVHQLFQEAQRSIQVMMFSARYYTEKPSFAGDIEHVPGTPWSDTNILLDDLIEAAKRDVDVLVILDSSTWNRSNTELNEAFGRLMAEGGVAVYMDDPEVTTHCKLILVDDQLTVVGSTNWSYYALDQNNETSVLIRSPRVNREYREYYQEVLDNSTLLDLSAGEQTEEQE
jgi:phosphatidylserine/phosphatidylglycerophosphate/cardiolipin synthase-like enzyme